MIRERHQHLADPDRLVRSDVDFFHAAAHRRGNLDLRLVGLHLEQRRVLADGLALSHEHADDLRLHQSLTEIGQHERAGHQYASVSRAAASTRAASGTLARSRAKPTNGTS
jgi:hypothetical protein